LNLDAVTTAIGQVGLTLIVIAVVVAALEGLLYVLLVKVVRTRYAIPMMLVAPAALGLLILIGYPLLWELNVSFTSMSLRNFKNPGSATRSTPWRRQTSATAGQ
jgi:arabinogalactan oligomer/maltooligosaccharide transport system permease protein